MCQTRANVCLVDRVGVNGSYGQNFDRSVVARPCSDGHDFCGESRSTTDEHDGGSHFSKRGGLVVVDLRVTKCGSAWTSTLKL
jgi:hypothetical protein